jgi:aconitate hydratase
MNLTLAEKIISALLLKETWEPGEEIEITDRSYSDLEFNGTLAYLSFEALNVQQVKTKLSLSFVNHNMLHNDFRNADNHPHLQGVAAKHGIVFSRPGYTLLGSDSHTPNAVAWA